MLKIVQRNGQKKKTDQKGREIEIDRKREREDRERERGLGPAPLIWPPVE